MHLSITALKNHSNINVTCKVVPARMLLGAPMPIAGWRKSVCPAQSLWYGHGHGPIGADGVSGTVLIICSELIGGLFAFPLSPVMVMVTVTA